MPYNGSGSFSRSYSWTTDANNGLKIDATRMDTDTNDIASGLSNVICKDGQTTITADIPLSNHKLTGVATGTARTDAANVGNVQDGLPNWVAAGGTADAITATYSPALTTLNDGQLCYVRAGSANTTTTPTFSPNGLTAHPITKLGGTAVAAGQWSANQELTLRYNLANTRWELLSLPQINGADVNSGTVAVANGGTGASTASAALTNLGALPLAGGTMTGELIVNKAGVSAALTAAAGNNRLLQFQTGGTARWGVYANSTAESGSNAGSDFQIASYTDAGAVITNPLTITRSTGIAAFSARPTFNGATPWDSANASQSLGSSGYQKFPSGLIIQWIYGTLTATGSTQFTLPTTFPTAILFGLASVSGQSSNYPYSPTVDLSTSSTSHITIWGQNGISVYVLAIGN